MAIVRNVSLTNASLMFKLATLRKQWSEVHAERVRFEVSDTAATSASGHFQSMDPFWL